jgi:hypothetical protein
MLNELLPGLNHGRPGRVREPLDLLGMTDQQRVALIVVDAKPVGNTPRRSALQGRQRVPIVSSPESSQGQTLLPPA